MRNLKRVLSLALAALMLMGMMVVGAGAASKDFTDADEITNVETVDVMVALGVLEGGDKGDFQPNSILTREQAAKIICYLLLGEEAAEKLTTNYPIFSDVPANRWSAPYISYCVNLGILAGDGAGHFYPEGKLTGVAFAKMLLVGLGYSAEREHYVGNNWEINVSAAAIATGVAPKALDMSKELSRQDAAQMAFNTLKATMVEYLNDNTIIIGGETIVSTTGKASSVAQGVYDDTMDIEYLQFAEKYFPKLVLDGDVTDAFSRPAHTWNYKTVDVGTYVNDELLVAEYTDAIDGGDVYGDIGSVAAKTYSLTNYVDGVEDEDYNVIARNDIRSNSNVDVNGTGVGVLTQIFVDDDTKEVTIVIINTYLAEVTTDYNEKTEQLNLNVYDGVNLGGATPVAIVDSTRAYLDDVANLADFSDGDMVLVTRAGVDEIIMSVELADVVSGVTANAYTSNSNAANGKVTSITADGTKYSAAEDAFYDAEILYNYDLEQLYDYTYDLYLDTYGNIIGIVEVEAATEYVFVVGYEHGSSFLANALDTALVITTDGEMKTVDAKENNNTWRVNSGADSGTVNRWYSYTVDDKGVYTLYDDVTRQGNQNRAVDIDIERTTLGTGAAIAYGNSNSVYITVEADDTTVAGVDGTIVDVRGVTTGIKNTSIRMDNISTMTSLTRNVFYMWDANNYVTYAVAIGRDSAVAENFAYTLSGITQREYVSGVGYVDTYDAIVDGEVTELKVIAPQGQAKMVADTLYQVEYNADGYIIEVADGGWAAIVADNAGSMNTNQNSNRGYAQALNPTLTLKGATLWVNSTMSNNNYVILDDEAVFYVENADGDYDVYKTAESAIAAATPVTSNIEEDDVIDVTKLVAICDGNTGYATSVIIDLVFQGQTPPVLSDGTVDVNVANTSGLAVTLDNFALTDGTSIDTWNAQSAKVTTTVTVDDDKTFTATATYGAVTGLEAILANAPVPAVTISGTHSYQATVVVEFVGLNGVTYTLTGTSNYIYS